MSLQIIEFPYSAGKTLTVSIFLESDDTELASVSAYEYISGIYRANFNDLATDTYRFIVYLSGTPVYTDIIDLININGVYHGYSETSGSDTIINVSGECNKCSPYTIDSSIDTECVSWTSALTPMLRVFIGDFEDNAQYTDSRLCQILLSAGFYVSGDLCGCSKLSSVSVDFVNSTITPDPLTNPILANLIVLKAACLIDQSNFRLKAIRDGISAVCGPAKISVSGSSSYKALFEYGPCKAYDELKYQCCVLGSISEAKYCRMVVSTFVDQYCRRDYCGRG